MKKRNPWSWIPTLYFAEGVPNVLVTVLAVIVYMQLGMTDTELALYTSWLNLPWIIKPLWSPFVDLYKTKRWWVTTMQLLIGASLAGVAFTLNASFWFQGTMFFFFLMAFSSATHDIAADGFYMLELSEHDQAWFVGIRNLFYRVAVIFGNVVLVYIAGQLQLMFRHRTAFTWSLVFYGVAGLFIALWLYHAYIMPRPAADKKRENMTSREVWNGFLDMVRTFIHKMPAKPMLFAILFLLLYRFPEAMLGKMSTTFLMRPGSSGGLGLSPQEFSFAYGTVGVIGLMLGGILGGMLASRDGLKKLGFTALTLYMLFIAQGEFKTSHYAICTGISYLGLMLPGMVSGWLKDAVGYRTFFIIVMCLCLITFIVTYFIKIDPQFGKRHE